MNKRRLKCKKMKGDKQEKLKMKGDKQEKMKVNKKLILDRLIFG